MNTQFQMSFDYADHEISSEDAAFLEETASRIDAAKVRAVASILEVGKDLAGVQKKLANHGNGVFNKWIEQRCGFTRQSAYRYIGVHDAFGDCNTVLQTCDAKALYRLSSDSCPEAATNKALHLAKKGERITDKKAREIIAEYTEDDDVKENPTPKDVGIDLSEYIRSTTGSVLLRLDVEFS